MKNYTEFFQINESLINTDLKSIIKSNKKKFECTCTRIEYSKQLNIFEYSRPTYNIEYGDFKKSFNSKEYDKQYSNLWKIVVFLNYENFPILRIMESRINDTGINVFMTQLTSPKALAFLCLEEFYGNFEKTIDFFNRKFLSSLRLEIDESSHIIKEAKKIIKTKDESILIKELAKDFKDIIYRDDLSKEFKNLDFLKNKDPKPKTDISKLEYYLLGIEEWLKNTLNLKNNGGDFVFFEISKKSNPIKINIGLNKHLTDNISILSNKHFKRYNEMFKKINDIYSILEKECISSEELISYVKDYKSFVIDVNNINNESEFNRLISSYVSVSKFNL